VRIAYYVTGHGYGHATRSTAVMNALLERQPDLKLHIRSQAPAWVFQTSVSGPFQHEAVVLDAGMVEQDLLAQDAPATLARCLEIARRAPELVAAEVALLREQRIDCVVSDIPPLASAIAHEAGVPAVAVANFSWDFIYQPFVQDLPEFAPIIDQLRDWYSTTDLLLRLPWSHEMDAFPNQQPIPLVSRRPTSPRESIRQELARDGVSLEPPLVLLGGRFPGLSPDLLRQVLDSGKFTLLAFADPGVGESRSFKLLGAEWQPRFVDVLHACDAVVSKLGYGIAAECVACGTRILYPPRERFAEHPIIESDLPNHVPTQRIERSEFESGQWVEPLETLLARPRTAITTPTNGAEIAAHHIIQTASHR